MSRRITTYLQRHHIALLALFIALGGTSFAAAATFINGKQIKPGSLPKNRLTKSAIKSLKGNKGAQGTPGQRGPTGPQGAQGVQGVPGAAGSAIAYVHFSSAGVVDAANSKNVAQVNISKPASTTGTYCIGGLSFPIHNIQVTLGFNGGAYSDLVIPDYAAACGAGNQFGIRTFNLAGASANNELYVAIN